MTTLHLLAHSPFTDSRLSSCLRLLGSHDGLLLSGDAVYALQPGTAQRQAAKLIGAAPRDRAGFRRQPVKLPVVEHHRLPVARPLDIEFDAISGIGRRCESRQRVFRHAQRMQSAMRIE